MHAIKIHLFVVFIILCFGFKPNTILANSVFTIEDITVDVTAKDAITAREKAFNQAQIKAFHSLAIRILPDSSAGNIPKPSTDVISTLIQDFELTDEKLSTVRYMGTYTFRFKDRDVRRYFSQHSKALSDVQSKTLLILPFLRTNTGDLTLWGPDNQFLQAWQRLPYLQGLIPMEVPVGDLSDVRFIDDDEALTYDANKLSMLLQNYNAEEAVILIADQPEKKRLTVDIYRTDMLRPELVQQIAVGPIDESGDLFETAAQQSRGALQKDWKQKTASLMSANASQIGVIVPISSLNEWLALKSSLQRMNMVEKIKVNALRPGQADIDLIFQGDMNRLNLALAQNSLTLQRERTEAGQDINVLVKTINHNVMRF